LGGVNPELWTLIARMGLALILGTLLAWRPLSRLFGGHPTRGAIAPALLLMTLASMFAMMIIGDSVARAFGVVGLGSFVRFRTSIKSPADAVLFFIAIGVGMACGLGVYQHAAIAVAILSLVLIPIDRAAGKAEEKESAAPEFEKASSNGGVERMRPAPERVRE
jgi:uncharacterized membrane protein YhiD involved in acid resistance